MTTRAVILRPMFPSPGRTAYGLVRPRRLNPIDDGKAQQAGRCSVVLGRYHRKRLLESLLVHLVEMIQRGVHRELTLQNLAVDHGDESRAEIVANSDQLRAFHLLVVLHRLSLLALQVLIFGVEGGVEGRFESVRVDDTELLEHDKPRRRFLVSLIGKLAVTEREESVLLSKKVWKDLDQVVVLVLVDFTLARDATIHEDVPLATMSMHITEKNDLICLVVHGHKLLCEIDYWVQDS